MDAESGETLRAIQIVLEIAANSCEPIFPAKLKRN